MRRVAHNVWTAKLSTGESNAVDTDFMGQEIVTGTFRRLVAEVNDEHAKALHLVKARPRKLGT